MHNKDDILSFLKTLQSTLCETFETFEKTHRFQSSFWDYAQGRGGGHMRVLRGDVFEKAAVNFSEVHGECFPMQDGYGPFFATGVSLITHMTNPHAPTAHFNIRYIETKKKAWLAGGYDLTPMGFAYEEDKIFFHGKAKETLDTFNLSYYPMFSKAAKEYFFIPHRKKERGVGGIFFDHFVTENPIEDLKMWKEVGISFSKALMPIYERRINSPYTVDEKTIQGKYRAHYVEFNLLYDRGTKFGFLSNGNPEAILCSMPPTAYW